jgi:hypothetical protein
MEHKRFQKVAKYSQMRPHTHTPNVARFYSPNTQITEQKHNTHACTKLLETQIAEENTIPTHTQNYNLGNTNH